MTGGLMLRGELIGISAQYREAVFYTGRILKARNPPTCRCSKNLRSRAGCEPGRKFERGFDELAARHIDMLLAADPKMALSVRSRRRVRRRSMIAIDYDPVALGYVMSLARHRHRATSRRDFVPWCFSDAGRLCASISIVTPRHLKTRATAPVPIDPAHRRGTSNCGRLDSKPMDDFNGSRLVDTLRAWKSALN